MLNPNFFLIFRAFITIFSPLLIRAVAAMPGTRERPFNREFELLQVFLNAGHLFLWREETYRVLPSGEHSLVHVCWVLRVPAGGWFDFPATHDYVGWWDIVEFAEDLLVFFRNRG